jgi:5-methylcytosine-specific restriction endonuclease McrA
LKNPRISKKEQNLIKGALRRVFSRSELRRSALAKCVVPGYSDPERKRVTKWGRCTSCNKMEPAYKMQVDHISPVIRLGEALEDLTWDELIDRLWCIEDNLAPMCVPCHKAKSKAEQKERRRLKKEGK